MEIGTPGWRSDLGTGVRNAMEIEGGGGGVGNGDQGEGWYCGQNYSKQYSF